MSQEKRIHVQHYYSTNEGNVPSPQTDTNPDGLEHGELAINAADEKLFIVNTDGEVAEFSSDKKLEDIFVPRSSDDEDMYTTTVSNGGGTFTVETDSQNNMRSVFEVNKLGVSLTNEETNHEGMTCDIKLEYDKIKLSAYCRDQSWDDAYDNTLSLSNEGLLYNESRTNWLVCGMLSVIYSFSSSEVNDFNNS